MRHGVWPRGPVLNTSLARVCVRACVSRVRLDAGLENPRFAVVWSCEDAQALLFDSGWSDDIEPCYIVLPAAKSPARMLRLLQTCKTPPPPVTPSPHQPPLQRDPSVAAAATHPLASSETAGCTSNIGTGRSSHQHTPSPQGHSTPQGTDTPMPAIEAPHSDYMSGSSLDDDSAAGLAARPRVQKLRGKQRSLSPTAPQDTGAGAYTSGSNAEASDSDTGEECCHPGTRDASDDTGLPRGNSSRGRGCYQFCLVDTLVSLEDAAHTNSMQDIVRALPLPSNSGPTLQEASAHAQKLAAFAVDRWNVPSLVGCGAGITQEQLVGWVRDMRGEDEPLVFGSLLKISHEGYQGRCDFPAITDAGVFLLKREDDLVRIFSHQVRKSFLGARARGACVCACVYIMMTAY